ncbi:MAG: hypothetical protein ABJZ55_06055 [Fuerstiella sp.]
MPHDFYRKERPSVFEDRFSVPSTSAPFYGLKTAVVFEAKNFTGEKRFSVTVAGAKRMLIATVAGDGFFLLIKSQAKDVKPHVNFAMTDANMHDTLKSLPRTEQANSILYQVAKKLCVDHATSSKSSPLISGCIVNNFAKSSAYDGFKLHLKLKHRQPFENPFASGNEKEYFLIGRVTDGDCKSINFYGRTNESKNHIVRSPGSRIPDPKCL